MRYLDVFRMRSNKRKSLRVCPRTRRGGISTLSFERLDDRVVYAIDYFVSSLQVLGNGQSSPSGSVSVSITVDRTGDDSQHPGVAVNLYLSRQPSFSTSDKLISQAFRFFASGQTSSTFEMSVTLPNAQDSIWSVNGPFYTTNVDGPYYIGSIVDPNNFVVETNEVNNANRGGMIDWNVINVTGTNSPPRGLANHAAKSFDGNTRGDLVGFHNQQIWVATSDGTSLNSAYWGGWDNTVLWNYQGVGDFDGDGKSDVVGFSQNGSWWVGRSDGSRFEAALWTNWGMQQYRGFYVGDFNGDGRDDVAARDAVGNWKVGYSNGNSFQTTNVAGTWDSSQTWYDTKVGDLNGDGRFDIVSRTEAGQWVAYLGQANGQLTSTVWGAWSDQVHWFDVLLGDINGDGRDDLVGRTVYGQWWVAKSSTSGSTNELWTTWSPTVLWFDVKLADVEGTGRKSLVGRTDSGQWWVGASDGSKFNNAYWGAWNGSRVWRDVDWTDIDGDGKADLIGRTNGMWWVAKSNGNSFSNAYVGYWAEVQWSSVSGTADLDDTVLASLPVSGYEPGMVTKIFGQVVIDRLDEQIATLSRVQANSNRQFDFSKLIAGITSQRNYLNAYNQAVDLIMAGTVKDVQIGGPEDLLNQQALLTADRSLLAILPRTTSSNQVSNTSSGEGEGDGTITVDPLEVRQRGEDFYNLFRDSYLAAGRVFDSANSTFLNRWINPLVAVVYGAGATLVDSGLQIARGNAPRSDVNRVNDIAVRNPSRPVNIFDAFRHAVIRRPTEKPSSGRVMFDDSVSNVLKELDRNSQGTYADQSENNLDKLSDLLLPPPTPNPDPPLSNNWWQGSKQFTLRNNLGESTVLSLQLDGSADGTFSFSGMHVGSGSVLAAFLFDKDSRQIYPPVSVRPERLRIVTSGATTFKGRVIAPNQEFEMFYNNGRPIVRYGEFVSG